MSTTVPRLALMSRAPRFMRPSCASPIMRCVNGVSGTCRVRKSDSSKSSSRLSAARLLPIGSRWTMSWKTTRMPIISASTPTCRPM
jgi:hypothetical protein